MPRASREQSEATAARVLGTARALFVERGYAHVGLEEVAAAADVTRGAVYHHFRSKKALFEAVLGQVQQSLAQAVSDAAVGGAWERLERGCRAYLAASTSPQVRRVLLVDAPAVLGWAVWRTHDAAGPARLLDQGLAAVDLAVPPAAAAALLNGAMNEAALWIAASDDPDAALDDAWQGLRRMLQALRRERP